VGAVSVGTQVGGGCCVRGCSSGFPGASRVGGPAGLATLVV
jgi:hypothetical protein